MEFFIRLMESKGIGEYALMVAVVVLLIWSAVTAAGFG